MIQIFRLQRIPAAVRSVFWQMLGSASTLFTALWITWNHGIEAQGQFGLTKSWFEAASALTALGLPHGLLHLMYRRGIDAQQLIPWIRSILSLNFLAFWLFSIFFALFDQKILALICASLPFSLAHLLARSWLLRVYGEEIFGILTAMPAVIFFIAIIFGSQQYALLLFFSACISGSTGIILITLALRKNKIYPKNIKIIEKLSSIRKITKWRFSALHFDFLHSRELWSSSLQVWMQAALGSAMIAALLSVVEHVGKSQKALGEVSLGLHIYQLFAVLAGYVAPLLFHRIAGHNTQNSLNSIQLASKISHRLLIITCILLFALFWAIAWQPDAIWPSAGLMCLAGFIAVGVRLQSTILLARSQYMELTKQAFCRLILSIIVSYLALQHASSLFAISLALLIAEMLTLWRLSYQTSRIQS